MHFYVSWGKAKLDVTSMLLIINVSFREITLQTIHVVTETTRQSKKEIIFSINLVLMDKLVKTYLEKKFHLMVNLYFLTD